MNPGINPKHLRECIIRPALKPLSLWTPAVENLLVGTAAAESLMGHYLMQNGHNEEPKGPALGIYQMEPFTYQDMLQTSNLYRRLKTQGLFETPDDASQMVYDLRLATIMCRIKYSRTPIKIPKHDNILELGRYWKKHYNSSDGKGEPTEFVERYVKYGGTL